jgi:hypothetical protein
MKISVVAFAIDGLSIVFAVKSPRKAWPEDRQKNRVSEHSLIGHIYFTSTFYRRIFVWAIIFSDFSLQFAKNRAIQPYTDPNNPRYFEKKADFSETSFSFLFWSAYYYFNESSFPGGVECREVHATFFIPVCWQAIPDASRNQTISAYLIRRLI